MDKIVKIGEVFVVLIVFVVWLFALSGCGTTVDRQTSLVETEQTVIRPTTIHTPFGEVTVDTLQVQHQRTQEVVDHTEKQINLPDVQPIIGAVAGTTPFGSIVSAVVGLGVAAFAGKKAIDRGRQRDELIAGIERSKDALGDRWGVLTTHLEAEQSADTKRVVMEKTA